MIMIIFGEANICCPSSQYDVAAIRLDEGDSYYVKLVLVLLQGLYGHYCMYTYVARPNMCLHISLLTISI